jgi:FHA domain
MPACPAGHDSSATDFCDTCGMRIDGQVTSAGEASAGEASADEASAGEASAGEAGTGEVATAWSAVVTADRAYYDTVIEAGGPDAASIEFPGYCPERRFPLTGGELRIGRRSASRGLEPEIDLTGPPADPGISHLHAVLTAQPDATWSVLDPGSSNGTQVNGIEIAEGVPVPLQDGDRISLGAWTVLTIHEKAD